MSNELLDRLIKNFIENPEDVTNNNLLVSELLRKNLITSLPNIDVWMEDTKDEVFYEIIQEYERTKTTPFILSVDITSEKGKKDALDHLRGQIYNFLPSKHSNCREYFEYYVPSRINYEIWLEEIRDKIKEVLDNEEKQR